MHAFTGGGTWFHNGGCVRHWEREMGQPDMQQTFNTVSVEGFDQIYQPDQNEESQSWPSSIQGRFQKPRKDGFWHRFRGFKAVGLHKSGIFAVAKWQHGVYYFCN
jgi:hypothetical protein